MASLKKRGPPQKAAGGGPNVPEKQPLLCAACDGPLSDACFVVKTRTVGPTSIGVVGAVCCSEDCAETERVREILNHGTRDAC